LDVPDKTVSFFQPGEFFRKWKLGEPVQLTPAVILPSLFPNALIALG